MKLGLKGLVATLAAVVLPLGAAQAQSLSPAQKELAVENFQQADADEDGALDRGEFETLINLNADDGLGRAAMVRRFGKYEAAFDRMDANGDGSVTTEEIAERAARAQQ